MTIVLHEFSFKWSYQISSKFYNNDDFLQSETDFFSGQENKRLEISVVIQVKSIVCIW